MHESRSDEALLEMFATSRDERAFQALAQRYSGLIFHTAIRIVEDRTLAEDVGQRVLLALAKKPSRAARGNAPLVAWLHRATVLEARMARRTEARHQRKIQALMNTPTDPPDAGEPAWKAALPHLDAAIDTLPEADRHVILLHFVNDLTFPEIARRLGKSAAAVQKQSRRAVGKLHQALGRKGVALSIGILTTGLATEMSKASPVLLAPAAGSLSSLGKTTTIAVKKTTVAAIAATTLLCGVPLARQHISIRHLESSLATAAASASTARVSSVPRGAKGPSLLERLARDLKSKDFDMPRYLAAVDHIEGLGDEELIALIKEVVMSPMMAANREAVFSQLFDVLATRDPEIALNALIDEVPLDYIDHSNPTQEMLKYLFQRLSDKDSLRALALFQNHLEFIRSINPRRGNSNAYLEQGIRVALAYGLVFSAPSDAVEVLRTLPVQRLSHELSQLVRSREPTLRKDASGYIEVTRRLFPETEANEAVANLVMVNFTNDKFTSTDVLLEKYEFSPGEVQAIFNKLGGWHFEQASRSSGGFEKAIREYRAWLETTVTEGIDLQVGQALGNTVKSWSRTSEPIYQAMLGCRELNLGDDAILGLLETAGFTLGPERSGRLATMLSDPEAAREVLLKTQNNDAR